MILAFGAIAPVRMRRGADWFELMDDPFEVPGRGRTRGLVRDRCDGVVLDLVI